MFAENGKISYRQLRRLYVFNLLGVGTLVIPTEIALLGKYGFVAITLGFVMEVLFLAAISKIKKWYLKSKTAGLVIYVYEVLLGAFLAWVFVDLIRYSLIPDEWFAVVLIVILFISAYALSGGVECRARTYEIVFWFILVPLALMMAFALKDMHLKYFEIHDEMNIKNILYGAYVVFATSTSLFNIIFLEGYDPKRIKRSVGFSIITAYVIMMLLYAVLLGNFGKYALAEIKYPAVVLMSNVSIKGSFFKRTDALMLAVWFFTLFSILNMTLFYGMELLERITQKRSKKAHIAVTIAPTFAAAVIMEYGDGILKKYIEFLMKAGIPVMIAFVAIMLVSGCSAVELEERCFPMLAGIDKKDGQYEFYYSIDNATEPVYADGIEEAVNECESGLSKTADTNHLKVLLIGNELYDDENSYAKLIQYLKDSSKFPRNTYVCAVDDINKTFENMGDYYEQLLEKQEREEGLCLTTVGDIMDEYTNGL